MDIIITLLLMLDALMIGVVGGWFLGFMVGFKEGEVTMYRHCWLLKNDLYDESDK